MAQTYKFGNGTWARKKGSTLAYSDTNNAFKPLPFSFERDSIATRVNKEGLIEVVGNDIPRIDYTDSAEGALLLENSSTNLITYSEDFSQSSWVKLGAGTGSTAIVTSDYSISPDGTQNATRLQCDLNGGLTSIGNQSLIYDAITGTGDTSGFIYVKSNTTSSQNFYLNNSLNDFVIGVATTEWQKFELNWVASGNGRTFGIGTRGLTGSDDTLDLLIWGGQVEQGYPSSYIPTNGSTIQRSAETCNGSGNSEVFNDSQGVLFANIAANADDLTFRLISLSDGTTSNRLSLGYRSTSNAIYCEIRNGNVTQAFLITTINDIKTKSKVSIKYKENDFAMWVNGFEVSTDTSGITPINLSKINFDSGQQTGGYFYGNTKEIGYYDTALTDEELEYMTSYRSLNEMVTELNLNAL